MLERQEEEERQREERRERKRERRARPRLPVVLFNFLLTDVVLRISCCMSSSSMAGCE